jgi:DNA polymerase III alpha subunit (gram-positive type)
VEEMMSYIMVDIETDGPIPVDYSMICFGAVIVDESLDKRFYGRLRPISEHWIPENLNISGFSREETLQFDDPKEVMIKFNNWLQSNRKSNLIFISDNNGFDWQFINYYFHHFLGNSPFGYSSMNLGSLYKGLVKDTSLNFKHLRITKHTHNPVDDALGNAQVFLSMKTDMGLKVKL